MKGTKERAPRTSLGLRLSDAESEIVKKAATLRGTSFTGYIRSTIVMAATRELQLHATVPNYTYVQAEDNELATLAHKLKPYLAA